MNAIKILSELDYQTKKDLYRNVPEMAIPKSKFSDATTNGLTMCIMKWLTLKGHYCSRIQSQGQFQPKLGIFTRSNVKRGIGDVLAIINGQTLMIEVKVGKDKQSQYQKDTQIEVEQSGGTYIIARDFQSFYEWYQTFSSRVMTTAKTEGNSGVRFQSEPENIARQYCNEGLPQGGEAQGEVFEHTTSLNTNHVDSKNHNNKTKNIHE